MVRMGSLDGGPGPGGMIIHREYHDGSGVTSHFHTIMLPDTNPEGSCFSRLSHSCTVVRSLLGSSPLSPTSNRFHRTAQNSLTKTEPLS